MDEQYNSAINFALTYQLILGFLASMILDGGQSFQYWYAAMIAFWPTVILLILRNREKSSKFDLQYIKFGFFIVLFLVIVTLNIAWHLRGV